MKKYIKKYIAKPNTWFKEGTEVKFKEYVHISGAGVMYGLFEGIRIRKGVEYLSEEICSFDEFFYSEELIDL